MPFPLSSPSVCLWLLPANPAQATLLGLDPTGRPDVYSDWIYVNYSSGHLSAMGTCETFDIDHQRRLTIPISDSNLFDIELDVSPVGRSGRDGHIDRLRAI